MSKHVDLSGIVHREFTKSNLEGYISNLYWYDIELVESSESCETNAYRYDYSLDSWNILSIWYLKTRNDNIYVVEVD